MRKEEFMKMLEQAEEDEYGRLYVLGEYNNKIYFGTMTTICDDLFVNDYGGENKDTAELYDRHFWNDDTFEAFVISNKHNEIMQFKKPKRIKKLDITAPTQHIKYMQDKINEIIKVCNRYECIIEKEENR